MKTRIIRWSAILCAVPLLSLGVVVAQTPQVRTQKTSAAVSANLAAETTLQGTVVNYTPNSTSAPLGAHISVQTSSGVVDVHVGDARFLKTNNFVVANGNAIRLVGQTHTIGTRTVFFARVLAQGKQTLAVRSTTGMPLWRGGNKVMRTTATANQQGGAR